MLCDGCGAITDLQRTPNRPKGRHCKSSLGMSLMSLPLGVFEDQEKCCKFKFKV